MYTSVALVALTGFLAVPAAAESPQWWSDYGQARAQGQKEGKPLAVVIGSGREGQGKLSPDVQQLLTANYVCVYVDTSKAEGQKLATAFGIRSGPGLILSDRTGQQQAFYHQGSLDDGALAQYLQRFPDPNHVVSTTEVVPTQRTSYYPPQSANAQPVQAPNYSQQYPAFPAGGFGGFGGGSRGGAEGRAV